MSRNGWLLPGARMAAARVRPEAARVVFALRPFLEKHLPFGIDYEYRERLVKRSFLVSLHLFDRADPDARAVNQVNEFHAEIIDESR